MKQHIAFFLALTLILTLLAGCGGSGEAGENTTLATVADIFTSPSQQTQTGDGSTTTSSKIQPVYGGFTLRFGDHVLEYGEVTPDLVYEGEEMHTVFQMVTEGNIGNDGVGLMLLLDGIPQPYRTADQEEYAYLHTFYPPTEIGGVISIELIFTPVTGAAGDSLLLEAFQLFEPDYDPASETKGFRITDGSLCTGIQVIFNADPPEMEMPAVTERIAELSLEIQDLVSDDIAGWSAEDLQTKYSFQFSLDAAGGNDIYFGVSEDDPLHFHGEVFAPSAAQWALVLYIDNEPISVQPENIIQFSTPSGQKAVIDISLDMTGYREDAPFYAALILRNEGDSTLREDTTCISDVTDTYYFSREESRDAWLAKYRQD